MTFLVAIALVAAVLFGWWFRGHWEQFKESEAQEIEKNLDSIIACAKANAIKEYEERQRSVTE